jgi:23S rRNA (uracil1939-C5)-methyltransferase
MSICGFYREGSHVIVPVETCYIEDRRRCEPILKALRDLMKQYQVLPYNEEDDTGILRHAIIKTSYYQKEIMLVLVTETMDFENKDAFVKDLLAQVPGDHHLGAEPQRKHREQDLGGSSPRFFMGRA